IMVSKPSQELSPNEVAERGDRLFAEIASHLDSSLAGQVVAIDIDSQAYRVGPTAAVAATQLRESHPDAQVWLVRIGSRSFHRIGRSPRASA
ncbi:MAG: hypothetical protein IAG10_34600, partial [Planctomycetaceae bacterium]|nr:hypothetical protein [Planctomycetaceae bacterium]